jgi:uncharacterized RDD family membrane protein YckC
LRKSLKKLEEWDQTPGFDISMSPDRFLDNDVRSQKQSASSAETPPLSSSEDAAATPRVTPRYRCVCGTLSPIDPLKGGKCPDCGRRFSPRMFEGDAGDLTGTLIFNGSVNLASPTNVTTGGPARDDSSDELPPGAELEHFRIVSKLSRGGMGVVYHAVDESLQRDVALKVLRTGKSAEKDSQALNSLLQEARAQARVNHPHVVHIYYIGRNPECPFLAMELVSGGTLADRLRSGPLPFPEVVKVAIQVTDALATAARYEIVHADVKPSNILIMPNGSVKLSDFGLARRKTAIESDAEGNVSGTPNYLSPEMSRGEAVDFRSDLYSLGVTLFEATFGRLPYGSGPTTIAQKLEQHRAADIVYPAVWPADIPPQWERLLNKLMAKRPEDRFASHARLQRALGEFLPKRLQQAGRIGRGVAWCIDLMIGGVCFAATETVAGTISYLVTGKVGFLSSTVINDLIQNSLAIAIVMTLLLIQVVFGRSFGKMFLQLRMVDQHGHPLSRDRLALRSIAQYLPYWALAASSLLSTLSIPFVGLVIRVVSIIAVLLDAVVAVLHPRGLALHDYLFRSRVVLDSPESDPRADSRLRSGDSPSLSLVGADSGTGHWANSTPRGGGNQRKPSDRGIE